MSMKPWEREIIEYRPNIGLNRDILSVVIPQDRIARFKPSAIATKLTEILGIDVMEDLMATMSKATVLLKEVEDSLKGNNTFTNYQEALENGDLITARQIYHEHLSDIDGNADFDVYPVLKDSIDEMENYLDYLNKELFNGEVDYNDLQKARDKEEQQIVSLLDIESEDLRIVTREDLTDEQLNLIRYMIDNPDHPLSSEEEYLQYLNDDIRKEGSRRIPYSEFVDRVQSIALAKDKTFMFKDLIDRTRQYLSTNLASYLNGDIQGSLEYLVDVAGSLRDLKNGMRHSFDYYAKESQEDSINSIRVAGRDLREFLDQQVSSVKAEKRQLSDRLQRFYKPEEYAQTGAQFLMNSISDIVYNAESLWKYVMTEHIGTSDMNVDQNKKMFESLYGKRKHQTLYRFMDLIDREFDRENKEHELNRFISIHNLMQMR